MDLALKNIQWLIWHKTKKKKNKYTTFGKPNSSVLFIF